MRLRITSGLALALVAAAAGVGAQSADSLPVEWSNGRLTRFKAPVPSENRIDNVIVREDAPGSWKVRFDVHYSGTPTNAGLRVGTIGMRVDASGPALVAHAQGSRASMSVQPGVSRFDIDLSYPMDGERSPRTRAVVVALVLGETVLSYQQVNQAIQWPDHETWLTDRHIASIPVEKAIAEAVDLVDQSTPLALQSGQLRLERLQLQHPKNREIRFHLVRIALKRDWSGDGRRQAESMLRTLIQDEPQFAEARSLLGYVYTHQGRPKDALPLFKEADALGGTSPWLWTNWGEALQKLGQPDDAAARFRQAIARKSKTLGDEYARQMAMRFLIAQRMNANDVDGADTLFRSLSAEPDLLCRNVDQARFLVQRRGAFDEAVGAARKALDGSCDPGYARETMGLALYAQSSSAPAGDRGALLSQAHQFLPPGPRALYLLASSDKTVPVLRLVLAGGERIDQRDRDQDTALSLATEDRDWATCRRLVQAGARPTEVATSLGVPVALIPVVRGDLEGVRAFKQMGVDYAALRHKGRTAIDYARETGRQELLNMLRPGPGRT